MELGTLTELLAIAEQGCNFCKFLVNVAVQSGQVRESPEAGQALLSNGVFHFFQGLREDARVEVTPVASYEKSPDLLSGQMDKVNIKFADPFTFGSRGGGFQQDVFQQYSISLGIYTECKRISSLKTVDIP